MTPQSVTPIHIAVLDDEVDITQLLAGYLGMKEREAKILAPDKKYLTQSLERLVELYDAWGQPDKAAPWRKELEARQGEGKKP